MMMLLATVKWGIAPTSMNPPITIESVSNERRAPAFSTSTYRLKEKILRTRPQSNPAKRKRISGERRRMTPAEREVEGEACQLDQREHGQGRLERKQGNRESQPEQQGRKADDVARYKITVRGQDAFWQERDESDGHEQHHHCEGGAGVAMQSRRDAVQRKECVQASADDQRDESQQQVQARAAADRLVETARVTGGDVLREVADGRHRDA